MKKGTKIFLGVLLFIAVIGVFYFSTSQSVLSLSQINVGTDGQVYWTYFASASKPGETYSFSASPNAYTLPGTTTQIQPQKSISISISPKQPLCDYQLTQKTKSYGFLGLSKVTYYELNNPEKIAKVYITDIANGETKILDGTVQSAVTFNANGGTLVVETQGLLAGKFNCPEYSNEILLKFENGQYGFYKQNKFDDYFSSGDIGASIFASASNFNQKVGQDNTFTNSFNLYPLLSPDGNLVTGSINFGFPTFTITANQKYFKSTTYIPPVDAKPIINQIINPSEIQQNSQNSLIVNLINNGEKGLVIIRGISNDVSISPSSYNLILDRVASQTFNIVASNNIGSHSGLIEVCAVNQFEGNKNCDSKSFYYTITEKPANTFCGDGVCQTNENNATCPIDCNVINPPIIPPKPDECGAWVSFPEINLGLTKIEGFTIIPNLFCLINNLVAPIRWILAILGGILAGVVGFKFSGDVIGKKKRDKWIPIVIALALAVSVGALIFIYFWWGIATLVFIGIIKWILPFF